MPEHYFLENQLTTILEPSVFTQPGNRSPVGCVRYWPDFCFCPNEKWILFNCEREL